MQALADFEYQPMRYNINVFLTNQKDCYNNQSGYRNRGFQPIRFELEFRLEFPKTPKQEKEVELLKLCQILLPKMAKSL